MKAQTLMIVGNVWLSVGYLIGYGLDKWLAYGVGASLIAASVYFWKRSS
jgi:hypothetical protein